MTSIYPSCDQRKSDEFLTLWPARGPLLRLPSRETMRDIVSRVSAQHDISVDLIKGPRRDKPIFRARAQAMYEIRQRTSQSYPAIGRFFGGRDHTTVIAAVKRYPQIEAKI